MNITPSAVPTTISLAIDGMTCAHCVAHVARALSAVPGARVTAVAVGSAQIVVTDPATVKTAVASLADAGYTARPLQTPVVSDAGNAPRKGGCCGGPGAADGKSSCCG
jgi:copper chaperone CopZ